MDTVLNDVDAARKIINGEDHDISYGRLYLNSNENLEELFQNFSVFEKNVLTVLGSSDQFFYSYLKGAHQVDTFDINRLTKYYFYLRKWVIEYYHEFYPDCPSFFKSHCYLYDLLKKVECFDEKEAEAYSFWNSYIQWIYPFDTGKLYYFSNYKNKIGDLGLLKNILQRPFTFYPIDLGDCISINKQYDVIIASNILEYYSGNVNHLICCRNNLYHLLKDNGEVILSRVMDHPNSYYSYLEQSIFQEYFNYEEFPYQQSDTFSHMDFPIGYRYVKKNSIK